jgi:biopolymer transport protein ExbB/TolQ
MLKLFHFIVDGFTSAGSSIMWVIMLVLAGIVAIVIERVWFLYFKCGSKSANFMASIQKYLKAGDFDKALKYAQSLDTPLAKGVASVLENRKQGRKQVQKAVDEVFLTETPRITRLLPLLNTLSNLATLLGLTGTIYGLMLAFESVANVPAAQRAQALASGISVAMTTTLFGLIVAVPTLLLHGVMSGRADKITEEMDEKTTKLMNLVEE